MSRIGAESSRRTRRDHIEHHSTSAYPRMVRRDRLQRVWRHTLAAAATFVASRQANKHTGPRLVPAPKPCCSLASQRIMGVQPLRVQRLPISSHRPPETSTTTAPPPCQPSPPSAARTSRALHRCCACPAPPPARSRGPPRRFAPCRPRCCRIRPLSWHRHRARPPLRRTALRRRRPQPRRPRRHARGFCGKHHRWRC